MRRRAVLLFVAVAIAMMVIWLRAFHVQVISHTDWVEEAARQNERTWDVSAPRGRIVDADGETLATDRAAVRLVFIPGEWATRQRWRCPSCGAVIHRPTPRFATSERASGPPRRCTCGAKASSEGASPAFDRVPEEDLGPLEDALGLPSGTLAAAAEDRMRDVLEEVEAEVVEGVLMLPPGTVRLERRRRAGETGRRVTIAEVVADYAGELEGRDFYVDDLRRQRRADLLARPVVLTTFRTPAGDALDVKSLPPAAERLLELDRDGRYRGFRSDAFRQRWYPRHALLSQCLGMVTPFRGSEEFHKFRERFGDGAVLPDTRVGRLGVEAAYDDVLRGTPGRVRAERDDDGVFSIRTVVTTPQRGEDVRLSLTAEASKEAYDALVEHATDAGFAGEGPGSGALVVMDAETGAILAWAETPLFDPNESVSAISTRIEEETDELAAAEAVLSAPPTPLPDDDRRRAKPRPPVTLSKVSRVGVEPGSSMKLVTVYTLLVSGHPVPEGYQCAGATRGVEPRFPKCHDGHGPVGPVEVLGVSCNRWCADCASDVHYRRLHLQLFPEWAARFGIGARTGADVPGEGAGIYPALDGTRLRQVSIGQSMLATPLQMARIAAALANGRGLPTPRVVASVGGRPVEGGLTPIEFDAGALAVVRRGMRACVDGAHGTADGKFRLPALAGVTVYGKTGTATVTGRDWLNPDDTDASDGPWHLWFVGYSEKPGTRTLAFAAVLHDRTSGVGGDAAAPVLARFLSWWYASGPGSGAQRHPTPSDAGPAPSAVGPALDARPVPR